MKRYRYDTFTDPEPVNLRRIRAEGWNTWRRLPCRRTYTPAARHTWPMGPRRAHRRYLRILRRWHTAHHGLCHPEYGHDGDGTWGHSHWFDGDKHRPWQHLRGDRCVTDLDLFRAMHCAYRARRA